MKKRLITVVVPARNEERHIEGCLNSLLNIKYKEIEIIAINDGSTDKTREIMSKFGERIKILSTAGVGPSKGRNLAIEMARGEYIAFTDADCVVDQNWLDELLKGFATTTNGNVVGVGGSQARAIDESEFGRDVTSFFRTFGFVSDYISSNDEIKEVNHNPTCNVIYKRSIFDIIGKFREDLWPCEDLEFDLRVRSKGYALMNNPLAVVSHYRPGSLKGFAKMMYRYGIAHAKLNLIHGFSQLIHYMPLIFFIYLLLNLFFLKSDPFVFCVINAALFAAFLIFLVIRNQSFLEGVRVLWLFIIALIGWNSGFFIGSGTQFWTEKIK